MRLLIATGGSPHSEVALRLGAYILQAQGIDEPPTIITIIKHEADRSQASRILAQASEVLRGPGITAVRTKVRVGRPAERPQVIMT